MDLTHLQIPRVVWKVLLPCTSTILEPLALGSKPGVAASPTTWGIELGTSQLRVLPSPTHRASVAHEEVPVCFEDDPSVTCWHKFYLGIGQQRGHELEGSVSFAKILNETGKFPGSERSKPHRFIHSFN